MITRALTYGLAAIIGVGAGVTSALLMSGLWSTKQPMEFSNINVDGRGAQPVRGHRGWPLPNRPQSRSP
ncbi:MAG: hypothetical protein AAFY81_11170, partial [Pseudomonadota bacterium]